MSNINIEDDENIYNERGCSNVDNIEFKMKPTVMACLSNNLDIEDNINKDYTLQLPLKDKNVISNLEEKDKYFIEEKLINENVMDDQNSNQICSPQRNYSKKDDENNSCPTS